MWYAFFVVIDFNFSNPFYFAKTVGVSAENICQKQWIYTLDTFYFDAVQNILLLFSCVTMTLFRETAPMTLCFNTCVNNSS